MILSLKDLLSNGSISQVPFSCDRAALEAQAGKPECTGGVSRKHKRPVIWKYGDVEFFFSRSSNQLEMIHIDHFSNSNGTPCGWGVLEVDPWFVQEGMEVGKFIGELMSSNLSYSIHPDLVENQEVVVLESGVEVGFVTSPDDFSDFVGLAYVTRKWELCSKHVVGEHLKLPDDKIPGRALILDPYLIRRAYAIRTAHDNPPHDEVWDGTLVLYPLPDNEHQKIKANLLISLGERDDVRSSCKLRLGVNVSDRHRDWLENYRCPDLVAYLPANPAVNHDTHWVGGPDFLVEITSPGEDPRQKLDFYAKVNTREVLIVDREPWTRGTVSTPERDNDLSRAIPTLANFAVLARARHCHSRFSCAPAPRGRRFSSPTPRAGKPGRREPHP